MRDVSTHQSSADEPGWADVIEASRWALVTSASAERKFGSFANEEKCARALTWTRKASQELHSLSLTGSRQNKSKSGHWIMRRQFHLLHPAVSKKAQSAVLTHFHSFTYRIPSQSIMLTGYFRDNRKRLCDKNNTDYVRRYPWIQDPLSLVSACMERLISFHLKWLSAARCRRWTFWSQESQSLQCGPGGSALEPLQHRDLYCTKKYTWQKNRIKEE